MVQKFEFKELELKGAYEITPFYATDERGGFVKDYNIDIFENNGIYHQLKEVFYTISKRLYEENYNEKEADRLRYKVNSSEEYLENVMLMDRQIKVIKHDMKRQLQILTNLITLEKYDEAAVFLRQYGMSLEKIQDYIHTENAFVNTLINNKIAPGTQGSFTITIDGNKATLNEPLYIYQGDRYIDVYFTIVDNKFKFLSPDSANVLIDSSAQYSTIKILKPNGEKIITEKQEIDKVNNQVIFTINKEFADAVDEIGVCKLQIQLWSEVSDNQGRVTIPYIEFEVLEPIFEDDNSGSVVVISCKRDDE